MHAHIIPNIVNSDRLEKVQTEAARIVTGLTSYASLDSIYCETGWEELTVRREFYKIINNEAPEYLSELIPPTVAESNNYNLRNRHNISQLANNYHHTKTHSFRRLLRPGIPLI